MEYVKTITELQLDLKVLENNLLESIIYQLRRLDKTLIMTEWHDSPFHPDLATQLLRLRLEEGHRPIVECVLDKPEEKDLMELLQEQVISHAELMSLLRVLVHIPRYFTRHY
ncbi:hypothetical protein [Olivibacter jilunii]|uniref:hypothetical protein n=1 Tax=Olivibacter jilunii TaxID=985016 RepID=UPI00102FD0FB|nr:hypothetical protein [Olivibacter jilunii]